MTTAQQLNNAIRHQRAAESSARMPAAWSSRKSATRRQPLSLCLQGAHLMTWQPRSQAVPVVWLSRDAKLAAGKSIRGGAPVCWPWFGAHASESGFPGHGFARTVPWQVIESGSEPDGATRLTLRLVESEKTRAQWPHDCRLDLTVIVGETLRMELTTENTGACRFRDRRSLAYLFPDRRHRCGARDRLDRLRLLGQGRRLRTQKAGRCNQLFRRDRSRLHQYCSRMRDRRRQAEAPYSCRQVRQPCPPWCGRRGRKRPTRWATWGSRTAGAKWCVWNR